MSTRMRYEDVIPKAFVDDPELRTALANVGARIGVEFVDEETHPRCQCECHGGDR